MFQLVNLIFSSRESVVKFASAIVVALGFSWFSLLLYSTTVIYNINFVVSFLSCICLRSLGFKNVCSCSSLLYYHAKFYFFSVLHLYMDTSCIPDCVSVERSRLLRNL